MKRILAKLAVQCAVALVGLVVSRALLEVAHALDWYPENLLANFIISTPSVILTGWTQWVLLIAGTFWIWFAIDYFVYRGELEELFYTARAWWRREPYIHNAAPGLKWTKMKHGWKADWHAHPDAIKNGWLPITIKLLGPTPLEKINRNLKGFIRDWSNRAETEMARWKYGRPVDYLKSALRLTERQLKFRPPRKLPKSRR